MKEKLKSISFIVTFFIISSITAQEVIVNKEIVPNLANCKQFDVTLTITGNPPKAPQEVVLLIDNSGSMADEVNQRQLLDYAKDAAIDFVNNIFTPVNDPNGKNRVAIVSYNSFANTEITLTRGTNRASIINAINNITAGGSTNMEDALIKAKDVLLSSGSQATFDCTTSRSVILFTDGVPRWYNGLGNNVNPYDQCVDTTINTSCQTTAFTAGNNVATFNVNGETYDQQIFTVGFTGSLSANQLSVSQHTLNTIQNSGAYYTNNIADLTGIYNDILNQLVAAAKALPGDPLVTSVENSNFSIVNGSLNPSKGTATFSGQEINWNLDAIYDETVTLQYSVLAQEDSCGVQMAGNSEINYIDSSCNETTKTFDNPEICVPCPEVETTISRKECTINTINYSATINEGSCSLVSSNYSWKFYLNNNEVGSSNQLSGEYTYTGNNDFTGNFKAVLTYNGTYLNGCALLPEVGESLLVLPSPAEVFDTTKPVTPTLSDVRFECSATPTAPTTTDACDNNTITGTTTTTFPITTIGTTVVTWTFTDASGNSTTANQNVIVTCNSDLSLTKTVDTALPKVGSNIVYTITLTNSGPDKATGVEVKDLLPSGLTYVSHNAPATSTYNKDTGIWNLSSLTIDANSSLILTITATVNSPGVEINVARIIKSNQIDIDSTPN